MSEISDIELERIGRAAAEAVTGPGAVLDVDFEHYLDSTDQPAYMFSFVIDQSMEPKIAPGLMRIRLRQRIRDELIARGDMTYPYLKVISPVDWHKPIHA
jgi:hypothetical protein